jgi:uncharacterized membrane protein YphA (DoxX/SURF4 family)
VYIYAPISRYGLALLRVVVGIIFVWAGLGKVFNQGAPGTWTAHRTRRLTRLSAALAAAMIASACGGGNPVASSGNPVGSSGNSSGSAAGANATLLAPHPKSVSVTLDTAKATTAVIPVTGGTLTATGTDGSVFTLTIPDKALGGDEKVTMTPLSAVNGLPFSGGLVAGVQLEPDGLELFQMATLTIKPAKDVPIANQVAVSYHGTGDNLYMQPLDPTSGISMHILHFSGNGVASGITGEIEEQAKNPPTDAADQAAQQIDAEAAAAIAAERQAALTGQPPTQDVADILKGTLNNWFDQVVEPKVAAAQADYTLTDDAVYNALVWLRRLALLGAEDSHQAQIDRLTAQVEELRKAYEKALGDRCISQHDVSAVLPLLSLERQFQLVGLKTSAEPGPLDTVKKCLRFELDFETVSPFDLDGYPFAMHDRVMKLVLQPDFPSGDLTASQPHEILGVTSFNPFKRYDHPVSAQPFTVSNMSFHMHFALRRNAKSPPPITGVTLTIDPGEVTGDVYDVPPADYPDSNVPTYHCDNETLPGPYGGDCWAARHLSERIGTTTTFRIELEYVGTALFARKTYDIPTPPCFPVGICGDEKEKTTFDLRHAPGG